jgi:hypothetical protein
MSSISPRVLKGGLVVVDRDSGATRRVITLQYNPDSLTRSLQPKGAGDSGDRLEALRLTGPPVETISLEAELDAADQLEFPDSNKTAVEVGVAAQVAALEILLYPTTVELAAANSLAARGTIEILPATTPLILFVWGASRVLPIRITEFSVVEEAFDTNLNPIRAKISLGLRVLTTDDLPFDSQGGSLYRMYHQSKESLAARAPNGSLLDFGIGGIG